jgi:hypothetical protein
MTNSPPLHGLLFSQVGYDPRRPVRIVIRSTEADFVPDGAVCRLTPAQGQSVDAPARRWGRCWGSHWWVAEVPAGLDEGVWSVALRGAGRELLSDEGLRVKRDVLFEETVSRMAVDMLESRQVLAKAKSGWMDAGTMWQESNAQSSMLVGLLDVLEFSAHRLDAEVIERIHRQVVNGCEYLLRTQEKATELGHPSGAMSHDIIGHEQEVLPNDANKAALAWRRAAKLLPDAFDAERRSYRAAADRAMHWLRHEAKPLGDHGLTRRQRGIPDDTVIPTNEWPTRDLVMMCWAEFEAADAGDDAARRRCIELAGNIMARQRREDDPEEDFYGHFREFDSLPHSEPSWTHSILDGRFGVDAGGTFPHYLLPLVRMCQAWPDHDEASAWRRTLTRFVEGFLLPGCRANPFGLLPQGVFGPQGVLWFTATFHGMNAIYGLIAALALELAELLDRPELVELAYGNLQWIAGLNAGITRDAIATGCVVYRTDLPADRALPASMICGVGQRVAGGWFNTRGTVTSGFATGKQFRIDTDAKVENDAPSSFTDEDWIPNSAGFLSGVCRLTESLHR